MFTQSDLSFSELTFADLKSELRELFLDIQSVDPVVLDMARNRLRQCHWFRPEHQAAITLLINSLTKDEV